MVSLRCSTSQKIVGSGNIAVVFVVVNVLIAERRFKMQEVQKSERRIGVGDPTYERIGRSAEREKTVFLRKFKKNVFRRNLSIESFPQRAYLKRPDVQNQMKVYKELIGGLKDQTTKGLTKMMIGGLKD